MVLPGEVHPVRNSSPAIAGLEFLTGEISFHIVGSVAHVAGQSEALEFLTTKFIQGLRPFYGVWLIRIRPGWTVTKEPANFEACCLTK